MPTKSRSAARTSRDQREPTAGANHPPAWIKPQLAALVKEAPDGADWLHEIKLDGYRMHVSGCGQPPRRATQIKRRQTHTD
jgi:bifunctional non-homologous end joining protein LigD